MNHVTLIGRLTRDPEIRYTQTAQPLCIARYSLAVDRRKTNPDGTRETDFISCIAFGKSGEFAERYLHKGTKIAVAGRIQTGSYTNNEGQKVYTTDVVVEEQEFAESANGNQNGSKYEQNAPIPQQSPELNEGFMAIPDNADADGLPWN